jgi:hypothetical protein
MPLCLLFLLVCPDKNSEPVQVSRTGFRTRLALSFPFRVIGLMGDGAVDYCWGLAQHRIKASAAYGNVLLPIENRGVKPSNSSSDRFILA